MCTWLECYCKSAAICSVSGLNAQRLATGLPLVTPPRETALGSLCHYLVETDPKRFAPMNANFGVMPELPTIVRDKREKGRLKGVRSLEAIDRFIGTTVDEIGRAPCRERVEKSVPGRFLE